MDGVLADFDGRIGRERIDGVDPPEMFEKGFFRGLDPMLGAIEAVDALLQMKGIELFIATKPSTKNLYSTIEKYEWVNEHFPKLLRRMFLTCDKGHLNGHYLIDDDKDRWGHRFPGKFLHFDRMNSAECWKNIVFYFGNL